MSSAAPYDPFGQPTSPQTAYGGNSKTAKIQNQIDDTIRIAGENVTRLSERGEKISDIEDQSQRLVEAANNLSVASRRARRKMWKKDMKMRLCIILGVVILLIVIVVPIAVHFSK